MRKEELQVAIFQWNKQTVACHQSPMFSSMTGSDPEVERANPVVMCHADASKVNDGAEDLNEILLLLNVCPDEIERGFRWNIRVRFWRWLKNYCNYFAHLHLEPFYSSFLHRDFFDHSDHFFYSQMVWRSMLLWKRVLHGFCFVRLTNIRLCCVMSWISQVRAN